ncbi:MAG: lipase [Oscillospiraceae bacterium]|nr:lipase [Oscillospiraceae bacterium]
MKNRNHHKINTFFLFLIFIFTIIYTTKQVNAASGNDYPIVLVHGIYGWDKDQIGSYNYWGGDLDIVKMLNDEGFKAMNVKIGTFSSNWDRACELYYYIKGGTVDYGAAHSAKYGHERYGKTYPGLYKNWDDINKIHLLGHNFGGETIRLLVELLKNGDKDEQNYYANNPESGISPLFEGGKNSVASITTLGSQLNGATFVNFVKKYNVKSLYISLGGLPNLYNNNPKYDFGLDQWGLKRGANESIYSYYSRVLNDRFMNSGDNAVDDLNTDGAQALNDKTIAYSDIYYFSYNGNNSYKSELTGFYLPKEMIWTVSATVTGKYTQNNALPFGDKAWWKNDGAVSVISAQYPFNEPHKNYDGIFEKGVWTVYPTLENWAQEDFVGLGTRKDYVRLFNIYKNIAKTLTSLPK